MNSSFLISRLSYGLIALPLSIISMTYYVFLPKIYVDTYNASLVGMGICLGISRVFDAITDPLCGYYNDRLRRKNYSSHFLIAPGIIVLTVSFLLLCNPEIRISILGGLPIELYFLILSLFLYAGSTLVTIPYESLALELFEDSKKRSQLIGIRDGIVTLGILLSAVLPALSTKKLDQSIAQLSLYYACVLILGAVILPRVKRVNSYVSQHSYVFTDSIKSVFKNKEFRILLYSFIVNALGAAIPASLFFFFCKDVLGIEESDAQKSLVLYFVFGVCSVPIWLHLIKKYSKKSMWFIAQAINALFFIPVFFLNTGDILYYNVLISISAFGYGGVMILPSIIQGDIISAYATSDENNITSTCIGIWNIAKKIAQGLGAAIALFISGVAFQWNSYGLVLGILYCIVPSLLSLCSIIIATSLQEDE